MVILRQNWISAGKVVVFGKSGCIRAKVVVFGRRGSIQAKVAVFVQK